MPIYSWLTKSESIASLAGRQSGSVFWTDNERWIYLSEALRAFNGLTMQWNADLVIPNADGDWINTGTLAGSPRLRTVTDQELYSEMCYMLLEPQLVAGAWAGSSQFSLQSLQYALQKRTQEVIQATASNIGLLSLIPTTPGTRRNLLGDTCLQPRRIRFLPAEGFGNPMSLSREDTDAFNWFEPGYLQTDATPQSWSMVSEPPLSFDVDFAPNVPGNYEVIALQSGPTFAPPAASLLGVPDDWAWVPMYGALSDLLSHEPEATDRARSSYCLQRYTMGIQMMLDSNWLLQATINGVNADTPSLAEMDDYTTEWQEVSGNLPQVVQGGMDFCAPVPGTDQAVGLTLLGNAPLLDSTGTYVQVSRDDFEAVLNYAHHISLLKMGNKEFSDTMPLFKDFMRSAAAYNNRISNYAIFPDLLRQEGQRQDLVEAR